MMIWRQTNTVTFGMLGKKCDENISTKTPLNCDGEKCESYYSKLFKGYNDLDNNRNTSLKNLRRISNKSLEFRDGPLLFYPVGGGGVTFFVKKIVCKL